jgi:hypothetical protein
VRKAWGLLVWLFLIALIIIFINPVNSYVHWMLVLVPLASFHGAMYFYMKSRWVALIFHWLSFALGIIVAYELM